MRTQIQCVCAEAASMFRIPLRIEKLSRARQLYPESRLLFFKDQIPSRDALSRFVERMSEKKPYQIVDRANANWVLLSAGGYVLLAGPFFPEMLTRNEIGSVFRSFAGASANRNHYYEGENENQRHFREYCMALPMVNIAQVKRLFRFFCRVLSGDDPLPMETVNLLKFDPLQEIKENPSKYIGYREDCEAAFTAAIAHSSADKALEIMRQLYDNSSPLSALTTPWNEGFFRFCVIRTYARTGARRAGVPAVATERVADLYLKKALLAESPQQLQQIAADMTQALCDLVRTCSNHSYSPMISSVVDYIAANFTKAISPSLIAGEFGANASYLSARFHRETGSTLSAHINHLRLEYARTLLTVTDQDIGSICADVGIMDQSYFARIFREQYGISPTGYRLNLLGRKE